MSADGEDFGLSLGPTYDYGRSPPARPSAMVRVLTALGAFVVGVTLVMVVDAARDAAHVQDLRRGDLIDLIGERQARTDALSVRLAELRTELDDIQDAAGAAAPALSEDLAELEMQAGLTPVEGPGVRVTLADAGDRCASNAPEDCRILDTDIQLGVNTLFGAGAEAVAVNDERVIAVTAVRSAGGTILVNYRPLTSPYTIDAIGDPQVLRSRLAASTFGTDFALWREQFGLGYEVSEEDLRLPAHRGGLTLRTARAAGGAG